MSRITIVIDSDDAIEIADARQPGAGNDPDTVAAPRTESQRSLLDEYWRGKEEGWEQLLSIIDRGVIRLTTMKLPGTEQLVVRLSDLNAFLKTCRVPDKTKQAAQDEENADGVSGQ